MKVKRNSWHYTLYCFFRQCVDTNTDGPFEFYELLIRQHSLRRTYRPSSLCRYFWFCVACALTIPLLATLAVLVLGIIFVIIMPFFWLYERYEDRRDRKRRAKGIEPSKTASEPNMVRQFVKAKKDKVCPLIEVVD